MHSNWHTQKPICAEHFFPVQIDIFFSFVLSGGVKETAKIWHFVDFDWEKCIEMTWVVYI